jgi:hypothetical protein
MRRRSQEDAVDIEIVLWPGVADVKSDMTGNLWVRADEEAEVEDVEGWWRGCWDGERGGEEAGNECH